MSQTAQSLRIECSRVVDRLHSLVSARLCRTDEQGSTPADRAHQVAQRLADLAADAVGRDRRPVPRLADHAVGDQVAVLGADVLAEGDDAAQAAALAELTALRRSL